MRPSVYLGVWRRVLADRPDALWYPTINIGPSADWYDHITPLAESGLLRMSLSDPGSVNLGGRRDGLPSGGFVYANSFDDIAPPARAVPTITASARASRSTNPASCGPCSPTTPAARFRPARS